MRTSSARALRYALVALLAGVALSGTAFALAPTVTALQVTDANTGQTLAVHPIDDGATFEIRYVHSFEKTEIHETYVARGGEIVQVREAYEYHAAGLEHARETTREGNMTVSEFERELGTFSVRVASTTEQDLVVDGRERPLRSYAESGSTVRFSVERMNYVTYRFYETTD